LGKKAPTIVGLVAELDKDRGQKGAEVALRVVFGIKIKKGQQGISGALDVLDNCGACGMISL
jgi:hypothetical protein